MPLGCHSEETQVHEYTPVARLGTMRSWVAGHAGFIPGFVSALGNSTFVDPGVCRAEDRGATIKSCGLLLISTVVKLKIPDISDEGIWAGRNALF